MPEPSSQNWQAQPNQRSLPVVTVDGHAGGVAVENLQALGNVRHADAGAAKAVGLLDQLGGAHADPIVLYFNDEGLRTPAAAEIDASAFDLGRQPVLDRIFHQRLEQHGGHQHLQRFRLEFLDDAKLVAAEAHDFDIEIVVDELDFLAQRHKRIGAVQQAAQNPCQLDDQFARGVGVEAD